MNPYLMYKSAAWQPEVLVYKCWFIGLALELRQYRIPLMILFIAHNEYYMITSLILLVSLNVVLSFL